MTETLAPDHCEAASGVRKNPMPTAFEKHAKRAVPRYTSYPTAPHFAEDFPEATYRGWLARLDPAEPISLYLHVPFCAQQCWYCGCNMKLTARYAPVAAYIEHLTAEIDLLADALPARMSVAHLHFGGGTPTAIEPGDLAAVMARIGERFALAPGAELAIESDPRTLSDTMIGQIGELGFNRASFGVQEFDPKVQAAINRVQPPEMVAHATEGLRAVGVKRINFDLIYGLPYQTAAALRDTVEQCIEMQPDRIALFGYAHVPWVAKNQRMIPDDALPPSAERSAQAEAAADALVSGGYVRIGLDHFARPGDSLAVAAAAGKLRRNFQGYTSDVAQTLLGIGATSIGHTPEGHMQNISETGAWSRAVAAGALPVARGHEMSAEDALRGHVIERIMCDGAIDLAAAGRAFGFAEDWCAREDGPLAELERDGLVSRTKDRLSIRPDAKHLARIVASVFDTYLSAAAVRHSVAV
jgi:oxygen-independent coproporphyrinogen-3 oxidase